MPEVTEANFQFPDVIPEGTPRQAGDEWETTGVASIQLKDPTTGKRVLARHKNTPIPHQLIQGWDMEPLVQRGWVQRISTRDDNPALIKPEAPIKAYADPAEDMRPPGRDQKIEVGPGKPADAIPATEVASTAGAKVITPEDREAAKKEQAEREALIVQKSAGEQITLARLNEQCKALGHEGTPFETVEEASAFVAKKAEEAKKKK